MIRRAQAEALLKLAEALEECERNGVTLCPGDDFVDIVTSVEDYRLDDVNGMSVRMAIAKLYPESEATK
jgi:hypothetical protein